MDKPDRLSDQDDQALRTLTWERMYAGILQALDDCTRLGPVCPATVMDVLLRAAVQIALGSGCKIGEFMRLTKEALVQHDPDAYFKEMIAPRILATIRDQQAQNQAPAEPPVQRDDEKPN